jgi:hypothetical protein
MIHDQAELPVIPVWAGIHVGKGDLLVLDARDNGHDSR